VLQPAGPLGGAGLRSYLYGVVVLTCSG
jgi:hypothetical protein